jgi:hypothetical protein
MPQFVQTRLPFEDIQVANLQVKKKKYNSGNRKPSLPTLLKSVHRVEHAPSVRREFFTACRANIFYLIKVFGRFCPYIIELVPAVGLTWLFYLYAPPLIVAWYTGGLLFTLSWLAMRGVNISGHINAAFNKFLGQNKPPEE